MTIMKEETDVDWTTLIDFESEVPCAWNEPQYGGCENNVEWILTHLCCGLTLFACTYHKQQMQSLFGGQVSPDALCVKCNTVAFTFTFNPI